MKIRQFLCVLGGVVSLLSASGCQDHFKVYKVTDVRAGHEVSLHGQFDRGFKTATLNRVTHFANPVKKDDHRIYHPDYHLTWYALTQKEQEPNRTVSFKNQYGDQKWVIGPAKYLAVPTRKFEQGGAFPEALDHYKCYEVLDPIGRPPQATPILKDQWVRQQVRLGKPLYFCVPVEKRYQQESDPIKRSGCHLAVYEVSPKAYTHDIKVEDQFGRRTLHVEESAWLCVPSTKGSWE